MKIIHDLIVQKRSIFMLLLAIVLHYTGHSQGLWNKTYIEDRPLMLFGSVLLTDSGYTLLGVTLDKGGQSNSQRCLIAKTDETGNISEYVSVYDSTDTDYATFSNTLLQTNKGDFAFTGYAGDSLLFGIIGDSVLTYTYYTPNTYVFQGHSMVQHTADNSYYITGIRSTVSPSDGNIVLVKIDSAGNRIWEKYYGMPNMLEATQSITSLYTGNLLLGGFRSLQSGNNTLFNTWLIEVDTGGGLVREWFDPNDSTYVAEGLKQTLDGFVYGGQRKYIQIGNTIGYTGTVTKLDTDFNKQWVFNSGYRSIYTGISDVEVLSDGSIIACGQKQIYNEDSTILSGWVVKLTINGEVIWDRVYTGINQSSVKNFLSDIDVLPDGNLIAVGQSRLTGHVPPQVGWFLKLDSNGCEIENCVVGIEATPKSHAAGGDLNSQLQVWPNPFSSDLSIALTGEHVADATYTITNLIGQTVYQQTEPNLAAGYTKMLDLSYLPGGVYFVAVNTGDKTMVERVIKSSE